MSPLLSLMHSVMITTKSIEKSRFENIKEVNTYEFICLHSIKYIELFEKN